MTHYTLHSLDIQTEQALILETADKMLIRAPTADALGRKLAETEHTLPSIKLDRHCEEYHSLAAEQILRAYERYKPQIRIDVNTQIDIMNKTDPPGNYTDCLK